MRDSEPPLPGAMVKEVTPAGTEVKMRLSTESAASRVVAMAGPTALAVLKVRVSVTAGTDVADVTPNSSTDQEAGVFQEAPVVPLK